MPKDDFFDDKTVAEDTTTESKETEVEKIKVGDREFTQEELTKRVGLSDIAMEAEEKYDRPISKYWPEFTKTKQELDKTKAELEEIRSAKPVDPNAGMTDEEIRKQALVQAETLGLVTKENARQVIQEVIDGNALWSDINEVSKEAAEKGKPKIDPQELLGYMRDTGIKNPEYAYEIRFKTELKDWEKGQLAKIKNEPMVTDRGSTAGSKQPEPVAVTKNNLQELIRQHFNKSGQ